MKIGRYSDTERTKSKNKRGKKNSYRHCFLPTTPLSPSKFVSGPSPGVLGHTIAKMDLEVKNSGRSKTHYGLGLSSDFNSKDHFCTCVVSPPSDIVFFLCPRLDDSLEIRD